MRSWIWKHIRTLDPFSGFMILVFTVIVSLVVILLVTREGTQESSITLLFFTTALTALGSLGTMAQAREAARQRENAERPEVAVFFQPNSNRLIYCVIQNFGRQPAKNVRVTFDPLPVLHDGKSMGELTLFNKTIPYLPPNERYWRHLGPGPEVLRLNPSPIEILVKYESISGKTFADTITFDMSVLSHANYPETSIQDEIKHVADAIRSTNTSRTANPLGGVWPRSPGTPEVGDR